MIGDFQVEATDDRARAGVLETAHGPVRTPVFMPVGTRATVKGVLPDELHALGAQIVLGNTYHLHLRPGADLIAELGGLHRFMGWDRAVLTDSGGFQVFSLRHTAERVDDDGVRFRSVYDGASNHLTPELAMEVQRQLGSDIAMAFDECTRADATLDEHAQAVRRTSLWARRCREAQRAPGQLVFGIVQGSTDEALRERSIEDIVGLEFDGNAIGGLSVGEEREAMMATVSFTTERLPTQRPRYFMGIGDPAGVLDVIERGVDMFDCVLPTRMGRTGTAMTPDGGRINLRNTAHARDGRPLVEGCGCPACAQGFSRAYIRHLVVQREITGLRLLTLHNLHVLLDLVASAREAIVAGTFVNFRASVTGLGESNG